MHASLLGFCHESLILGDDIIGQVLRCVRGIEVTEDSVSIEVLKDVCMGGPGHYLGAAQTLGLMETEYLYPKLGNRMSPKEWEELGRPRSSGTGRGAQGGDPLPRALHGAARRRPRRAPRLAHPFLKEAPMRYGFIGLGNLGGHLAASLLREGFARHGPRPRPGAGGAAPCRRGGVGRDARGCGGGVGCRHHLPAVPRRVGGGADADASRVPGAATGSRCRRSGGTRSSGSARMARGGGRRRAWSAP